MYKYLRMSHHTTLNTKSSCSIIHDIVGIDCMKVSYIWWIPNMLYTDFKLRKLTKSNLNREIM